MSRRLSRWCSPMRRLVEDVEHADQPGADLGGQPDPLRLTAGERAGRAVQREVVQADVEQEPQPRVDLLEHPLGDHPLPSVELEPAQELRALADRQRRDLGDRAVGERDGQDLGLEPGALAGRARHLAHVALVALAAGVALGLAVPALEERHDALEGRVVAALAAVAVAVADVHLGVVAVQDGLLLLLGQLAPRGVEGEPEGVAEGAEQAAEVLDVVAAGPRLQRALGERLLVVGDDELGVHLLPGAEPVQSGQAPKGLLKENDRGSSSSKERSS